MALSPSRAVQTRVLATLLANADVAALAGDRVFDEPPAVAPSYPRVVFGPSQEIEDDTNCTAAAEVILQIDVFSRDQGRKGPCRDLAGVIKKALHRQFLGDVAPFGLGQGFVRDVRVFDDPDGITARGVVVFAVRVEDTRDVTP
jgi:hypothetical protein